MVLENDTTTWINGTINNGGFETGEFWSFHGNQEAGYISRSTTAHTGSWSCNITTPCNLEYSHSKAEIISSSYTRITALNQGNLSCWWYLDTEDFTLDSYSCLRLNFRNATNYQAVYYYLGYNSTYVTPSNSSTTLIFNVENHNTTGTWIYCQRNLWQDASDYFKTNELYLTQFEFHCSCSTYLESSYLTLLIDDMEHIAGAVNGAGFEDQPAVGSPLRGWGGYYISTDDRLRVTDTAYAGSKAANLTIPIGSSYYSQSQPLYGRPIRGSRNTYLDMAWRLDAFNSSADDVARIGVSFGDGKTLYYYLAIRSGEFPDNTNTTGYFNATGYNTLGTWHLMHRSLNDDYAAVFGSRPDTTLTTIYLYAATNGANRLSLLFDDLYLYDTEFTPINPLILLLPVIIAVVIIIIVLVIIILVWRSRRKS